MERQYELLSTKYINAKFKLEYICSKHRNQGIQSITYNNLKSGFGCKYCGHERVGEKRRNSFENVARVFMKHNMLLLPQKYKNAMQLLDYICLKHPEVGVQKMSASNARVNSCPYCNQSKGELKIREYLSKYCIPHVPQHRFADLTGIGGKQLSYDFYLPTHNLLIEYQGEYHDGSANNQTINGYQTQLEHDDRKREYATKHNIRLLEIWYHDFKEIDTILKQAI